MTGPGHRIRRPGVVMYWTPLLRCELGAAELTSSVLEANPVVVISRLVSDARQPVSH